MNDPNMFDRWGDQLPNIRCRGYDDAIDVQDGYGRYGPPGYHGERYEDELCDEEGLIERIDSYDNRSETYQGGLNGFEEFREDRNYYGAEGTVGQEDEPYESVAPGYQGVRYSYDEDTQDDRGTVGDIVYDRGMAPTKLYDRGDRGAGGGTVYDTGTVDDNTLYGRGVIYDRDMATRGYERDAVAVGEYDEVSVIGTEYDKGTIDGGGYNRGIIIDPDVDRGTVRGAEYDRPHYEPKVRNSAVYARGYGTGSDSDNMIYDKSALASSRRLNRRRQMTSPIPSPAAMAIHARISEDSPPLTSRSSERMKMRHSTSLTDLSHNNGRIKKHHSRESDPKIPPQHKQRGRKTSHDKVPQTRRETKEYVKPIEVLEFRPEPFPEADNDTFCLRDAPAYAIKQKKKVRPRKPQVSESSSSDDSDSSRDSHSSNRSSSSSGSSRTETDVDSRRKSKGKLSPKQTKGQKKHSKSRRGNYSDSESEEPVVEKTAVGTFLNFLGGGTKEPTKVVSVRRSRRKK